MEKPSPSSIVPEKKFLGLKKFERIELLAEEKEKKGSSSVNRKSFSPKQAHRNDKRLSNFANKSAKICNPKRDSKALKVCGEKNLNSSSP